MVHADVDTVWRSYFLWLLFANVVFLIGLWFARRQRAKAWRGDSATLKATLEAVGSANAELMVQLREQREETERSRQLRELAERKHGELITRIEGIQAEGERWRQMYQEERSGAMAAQDLMMRGIASLWRQVLQCGGKPRVDSALRLAMSELAAEAGAPPDPQERVARPPPATPAGTTQESS